MTSDLFSAMGYKLKIKMDAELFHSLAQFLLAHEHYIAIGVSDYGLLSKLFETIVGHKPKATQ